MAYDLEAIERGYGETTAVFGGHEIRLRYRADLDSRALIALKRATVGVQVPGSDARIPDVEAVIDELVRVLVDWDVTRGGAPVPITFDELAGLHPGLPLTLLTAVLADIYDPNARRPSRDGSAARAASPPTKSRTTTASSATRNGSGSTRPTLPDSDTLALGLAGASG